MGIISSFFYLYRSAFRHKGLTWINISGLSLGLAVVMFLLIYLQFEFSFDRHFPDADRIYRILSVMEEEKTEILPICTKEVSEKLLKEIPEVELTTRLYDFGRKYVGYDNREKVGVNVYQVDSNFLRLFAFRKVAGRPELNQPAACILTQATAERIFGKEVNPVGKTLKLDFAGTVYEVTAVLENLPQNTHFRFDMLVPLSPLINELEGLEFYTYLKFRKGVNLRLAVEKCNTLNKNWLAECFGDGGIKYFGSITEPLTSLHTSTRADSDLSPKANKANLIFIVVIALFILGVAVSNFIALSLIQGEKRALEISIRKTAGARQFQLVRLLMGETFFVTFLAFAGAIVLYYSFSANFAWILHFSFPPDAEITAGMWGNFILLFIVVSCLIGIYPAIYLLRFNPVALMQQSRIRKYRLTTASVVVQFAIVVFCVTSLLVVRKQLDYVYKLPLGFSPENVLEAEVHIRLEEFDGIRSELLQYPFIEQVGVGQTNPLRLKSGHSIRRSDQEEKERVNVYEHRIGPGYLAVYGIPVLEGNAFPASHQLKDESVILSESTVAALGLKNPVGKQVYIWEEPAYTVIGVVKDVLQNAHSRPVNYLYSAYTENFYVLAVKFSPGKYKEARNAMLKVLDVHYKGIPVPVTLTGDLVRQIYGEDEVAWRIIGSGGVLSVLLALLGLLALSGFVTRQRRKEISLHRMVGATIRDIVFILNYHIIMRILPAIPIGLGVSYYVMSRWLENFAYAITWSIEIFIWTITVTLTIIIITVFYQAIKAATANPVDALKTE